MNEKGIGLSMELVVVAAIMLFILVISFPLVIRYFADPLHKVGEFSSCEKGNFGSYGMCIEETSICPTSNNIGNAGSSLSGCPSSKTKSLLLKAGMDKKIVSQYSKCCIATDCSDIKDRIGIGVDSEYVKRKKHKIIDGDKSECIGFSENCRPESDCCCVLGDQTDLQTEKTKE